LRLATDGGFALAFLSAPITLPIPAARTPRARPRRRRAENEKGPHTRAFESG
jgi:hypothetical protein